ncbi:hypothetical protein ACOJBO_01645 [Rhizobium beringeri]
MRAIDAQRDAAQHWFVYVSEDLLYMQIRALITAFDAYLQRKLDVTLHEHILQGYFRYPQSHPATLSSWLIRSSTTSMSYSSQGVALAMKPGREFAVCWQWKQS